jgi:hypothetical protein
MITCSDCSPSSHLDSFGVHHGEVGQLQCFTSLNAEILYDRFNCYKISSRCSSFLAPLVEYAFSVVLWLGDCFNTKFHFIHPIR